MARKLYEKGLVEGGGGPGGGGGARPSWGSGNRPGSNMQMREDYLKGQVEKSIQDRGGYPTREGVPKMTKMQERMETRKAAQGSPDYAKRLERKAKFGIKFLKGGLVGK
jgi:hypothetical protein